jgi:hypothetical protein
MMKSALANGTVTETHDRVKALVAAEPPGGFVTRILGRNLGLRS